jgi:hypothetical protein
MKVKYPTWSHDGKYVYFSSPTEPAFFRMPFKDHERINPHRTSDNSRTGSFGFWLMIGTG